MINLEDQEELFRLIADYLEEDIECIAIGGTAMMFSGYKTATKDIDLVFGSNKDREIFISAIEKLGYKEMSLSGVYDKRRKKQKGRPLMFTRGDERFDLFVSDVFGFKVDLSKMNQRRDFLGKNELTIFILPKEYLILLKSVTDREKDLEDIESIMDIDKDVDWDLVIIEASLARKYNEWILLDLEEKMKELKKKYFIKKRFFDRLHEAEEKYH
jgi:hypothetical protein